MTENIQYQYLDAEAEKRGEWTSKYWIDEADEFHREDGPAVEYYTGEKSWYIHGGRHRIDGPAVMLRENYMWFLDNEEYNFDDWIKALEKQYGEKHAFTMKIKWANQWPE